MKEPKDLGIKIGTKEIVAWTDIRDNAAKEIEQNRRIILIDEMLVKLAEKKIAEEQGK